MWLPLTQITESQSMHESSIEKIIATLIVVSHVAESEGASFMFATENITILEQAFINARNG